MQQHRLQVCEPTISHLVSGVFGVGCGYGYEWQDLIGPCCLETLALGPKCACCCVGHRLWPLRERDMDSWL